MFGERLSRDLQFPEAARIWLDQRRFPSIGNRHRFISPRTLKDLEQYVKTLIRVGFLSLALGDIHLGHIRNYQEERAEEAGPNKINQEVGTLIRILKAGECWTPQMDEMYMPLDHIDSDIPRAITLGRAGALACGHGIDGTPLHGELVFHRGFANGTRHE
jgi:hypothetical protein